MGTKVTVSTVANATTSSGTATVNANDTKLADEFDKVVYRDGSLDMNGDLDMDGNRVINLPYPALETEAVTKAYLTAIIEAADPDGLSAASLRTDLLASSGSSIVGFIQAGANAVARDVQDKARERVSLEDFLVESGGNPRLALERASAAAPIVEIRGTTPYEFDQMATVDDTIVVGYGCTLLAASGYTDNTLIEFTGDSGLIGYGTMTGANMTAPSSSWAGSGIPLGSALYVHGTSTGTRDATFDLEGWTFSSFKGGPVFAKWCTKFRANKVTLIGCQSATTQWKSSGSYTNIPNTTNSGTSTAPVGEIITNAGIEVFQSDLAEVTNSTIPAISKVFL